MSALSSFSFGQTALQSVLRLGQAGGAILQLSPDPFMSRAGFWLMQGSNLGRYLTSERGSPAREYAAMAMISAIPAEAILLGVDAPTTGLEGPIAGASMLASTGFTLASICSSSESRR